MRLCIVKGKKALFHCWEQVSEVIPPSPMNDKYQGGTIRYTAAIVEYEDGGVERVNPDKIVFQDTKKLMKKAEMEFSKWETKQL